MVRPTLKSAVVGSPAPSSPWRRIYTIGGQDPVWKGDEGTDIAAVRKGFVSITPLNMDMTDYRAVVEMNKWRFEA